MYESYEDTSGDDGMFFDELREVIEPGRCKTRDVQVSVILMSKDSCFKVREREEKDAKYL